MARNYKDNIDPAIRLTRENADFRWTIESLGAAFANRAATISGWGKILTIGSAPTAVVS